MDRSSPENLILVTCQPDGIALVTINRPKSLNSLTKSMMTDLAKAFKSLDADDSVLVIILSGSGRSFCSGVDLTSAEDVFKGDVKDMESDPVAQMERCRKPIIGAIGGFAVTAGFEIALACDVLVASKGAKFMDTHARFGIFPSWGLSQKLSRIIGPNRAREVSLAAMPLTAEQAERLGFVNHLVEESELLKKAREIATAIIKNNQDLVLRYKSVINDGLKLDLGHALTLEKERAHEYYNGMTKEQFKKMQEFIAGRGENENNVAFKFKQFDIVRDPSDHYYVRSNKSKKNKDCFTNVNNSVHMKIMREWKFLRKGLPESIYVRAYEDRIDLLRAVIVGAPSTPYHDGLFFFDIAFPSDYPHQPPKVYYRSHGLRLNPNLYENGNVCLSLINTWDGNKNERWNSSSSTILQVLVSIQGLVLIDRPYFNEPAYAKVKNKSNKYWLDKSNAYNEDVFALSCKTMIYVLGKPPGNFEGFVSDHFCKRGEDILAAVKAYRDGHVIVGYYRHDNSSSSSQVSVSDNFESNMNKLCLELKKAFRRELKMPLDMEPDWVAENEWKQGILNKIIAVLKWICE
ncbi:unnamed protein product [Camellia sinensis]